MNVQVNSSYSIEMLRAHIPRLYRVVEESLEVAFILCNNELEEFGISKIFDVFNQIVTTGFILSTGYWPFFNSVRGQCLCVCGRYGIICRHHKNNSHWIDMQPLPPEHGAVMFYPKYFGNIFPIDYNIFINPSTDNTLGFNITVNLTVEYKKLGRGRPRRLDKLRPDLNFDPSKDHRQKFTTTITAKYNLTPEYYPALFTIIFQPNPFFHEQYGTYFTKLILKRQLLEWAKQQDYEKMYTVPVNTLPTLSIMLVTVNLPLPYISPQLLAILPLNAPPFKIKVKPKKARATQTPWSAHYMKSEVFFYPNNDEDTTDFSWNAAPAVNNLKHIANMTQLENHNSPNTDDFKSHSCALAKKSAFLSITDKTNRHNHASSMEVTPYDRSRSLSGASSCSSFSTSPSWCSNKMFKFNDNSDDVEDNALKLALKPGKIIEDNSFQLKDMLKKNSELFNLNFPPLKPVKRVMTKEEINSEFDIIEQVIKEDLDKIDKNTST